MIFKCKMCGGTVEFEPGASTGICDSCGTKQTLPRLDDDKRANLYDRANHFRRNNDFDKAMAIYEQILNEDNTDAEAYWSLVLCRYGIEYVEDPQSRKRVPTVNRAQFTSIYMDEDYKSALQYADGYQKTIYEEEAKAIDDIQKGILEISSKEDPFDVFICYKETDANGRRTPDSVLANDLYHQLAQEGFKVFFARITLEDKLGSAYEPYIFAALNSAKVMVVLGTKPEYFNAVWVKNEWSRYLALVKKSGGKRILIPAYKDMDPYDLPEEFSHLQAQDMSKLGFMQDLIRGIKKIVEVGTATTQVNETPTHSASESSNVTQLLKRASLFLEDGNWSEANKYCEKVLDIDPECAEAYLCKLMCEMHARTKEELSNAKPFGSSENYQKAIRFGREPLVSSLESIYDCTVQKQKEHKEATAKTAKKVASIVLPVMLVCTLAVLFLVKVVVPDMKYSKADSLMEEGRYTEALDMYEALGEYRKEEISTKISECRYNIASEMMKEGKYDEALAEFEALGEYRESNIRIKVCQYNIAVGIMNEHEYERAITAFEALGDYNDSKDKISECKYNIANNLMSEGKYDEAIAVFQALGDYKDCIDKIAEYKYNIANDLMNEEKYSEAIAAFEALGDYNDSMAKMAECAYNVAGNLMKEGKYAEVVTLLGGLSDSEVSGYKIAECKYSVAGKLAEKGKYDSALAIFDSLGDYRDSVSKAKEIQQKQKTSQFWKAKKVGDTVRFGSYEQDNNTSNGKESIEWIVLDKTQKSMLLISKYALDCQSYDIGNNESFGNIWEKSSLRKWLNGTFFGAAFSGEEQAQIIAKSLDDGCIDKVFLLNIAESQKYFSSDSARVCRLTEYAAANGSWAGSSDENCWWWLRSPGNYTYNAAYVYHDGSIHFGGPVDYYSYAVRPAICIDLEP